MNNQEMAKIFYEIADILEMQDVQFKPQAYRKAARSIESLSRAIQDIYKEGKLNNIPGVGKKIAKKITEMIETGRLRYFDKLKKQMPADTEELVSIEGIGPKTVKLLYKKLKIKNLKDLERAVKAGKLRKIEGLGEKTEQNILENLSFAKEKGKRILLGVSLPEAEVIREELKKQKEVISIDLAGSLRRKKETIGDIDILAASSNPEKTMDTFTKLINLSKILAKGPTKSSILLKSGLQVDLRIIDKKSYGSALLYFTGSKDHNIALRKIAQDKKLKLSEYGLFKKNKFIAGKTEQEIYKKLGLRFIEPELRENLGEIEAAAKNKLPKLVDYKDIKGDLQMHTKYSDGSNTIKDMALAAKALGHKFIAITDHTGTLRIAHGLDEKRIKQQMKEIDSVNKSLNGIEILKGVEVNIKNDGNVDVKDSLLREMDVVLISIHSGFKQGKEKLTNRILKAMDHPVNILSHPTGRIIFKRQGYDLDFRRIFEKAKERGIALEINAQPDRLDLNDENTKLAVENRVKLSIGTDAHVKEQLSNINLGTAVARRGWAEKNDIINTYDLKKLRKFLKK